MSVCVCVCLSECMCVSQWVVLRSEGLECWVRGAGPELGDCSAAGSNTHWSELRLILSRGGRRGEEDKTWNRKKIPLDVPYTHILAQHTHTDKHNTYCNVFSSHMRHSKAWIILTFIHTNAQRVTIQTHTYYYTHAYMYINILYSLISVWCML